MIDAVIFDMDGTLIDSVDLHAQAWLEALQRWGVQVPFAMVRHQIGKGGDQLLRAFFTEQELKPIERDISEWRAAHFRRLYEPLIRPFPGVRRLMLRLRAADKRIAIATSAKGAELARYLEIAQVSDLVDVASDKDDVRHSKPRPDVFAAALAKLGSPEPHRVLAVGDTRWDALAAKGADILTIGLLCGGVPASELRDAGCIAIYDDPAGLATALDRSPIMRGVGRWTAPAAAMRAYKP